MKSRFSLSRRTFLRGTLATGGAVVVGLPVLEAMLDGNGTALAGGAPLPKRFGVFFWGNGTDPDRFAPATTGAGWEPSEMLRGLDAVKQHVSIVSGATLSTHFHLGDPAQRNPHVEGAIAIMSAGNPLVHESYAGQSNDWDYMTVPTPSIDQLAAEHIAGSTPFRSLVIGITPVHTSDAGSSNHPGTAVSYISHSAPYLFNPPKMDPSEVFGYLFGAGVDQEPGAPDPMELARASVLDAVLADAAGIRGRLGVTDRRRLDEHMEGIHELQNRVRGMAVPPPGACAQPVDPGNPVSERERARAMADLVAMAFACDLTRVVSIEFSSPASHVHYPDIFPDALVFNGSPTSFHEYEHNVGIDDTVRLGLTYFIDVFGDLLSALKAIPEGEGTILDSACILGTSELSFGPSHGFAGHPLIIGGSAGGALQYPGVHVAVNGDEATRVPLTCLQAVGVPIDSWGDEQFYVDRPLTELLSG